MTRTNLLLATIAAATVSACGGSSSPPVNFPPPTAGAISMNPALWSIQYSPNMPSRPSQAQQGWQFTFPSQDGVRYVTTVQPIRPARSLTLALEVIATGSPFFDYRTEPQNTCDSPAVVRLFIQRRGDNYSGQGPYEYYRWWANKAAYGLAPGQATIRGDLTELASWTSVMGKTADQAPDQFRAALADVGSVGMTFGGGCFYGHGVFVTGGTATFTARTFTYD